jgi:hypothetical protein
MLNSVSHRLREGNAGKKEIVFESALEANGGFTAKAISESIFIQAEGREDRTSDVRKACKRSICSRFRRLRSRPV